MAAVGIKAIPGWSIRRHAYRLKAVEQSERMVGDAAAPTGADEQEWVAQVTRLYLIVNGRPPDPGGLAAYVEHRRQGRTLLQLAAEFLAGGEFTQRVQRQDPADAIYRSALGHDAPGGAQPALPELVESLVLSPEVGARLSVARALYPEGAPLDDPVAYRIWAAGRNPATGPGQAGLSASFMILLDRPNLAWLDATITSVLDQAGPVELLIVAGGRFPQSLRRRAAADARLRLVRALPWSGRAQCFNRALGRCNGDYAGLIGQHDLLAPNALAALGAAGAADIVITDDDALDDQGLRHSPRLGTAWDPDRVIAAGCPGLILARIALLRQARGMRPTHGQEEWDMLLRASAAPGLTITHLPAVLLSRRVSGVPHGSHPAHLAAARRYLAATGHGAAAVQSENGVLRVVYPLAHTQPMASVIIPTRDRADLMRTCMEGLLHRTDYANLEILIIDNGSTDPAALALLQSYATDPRVRILQRPGPFNWPDLNNFAVDHMRGDVAVLLNNDTEVIDPGWLREMMAQAMRPEVGAVGAKLLYGDRTIQHAGVVLGPAGRATHMWRHARSTDCGYLDQLIVTRQVTVVTGACLAVRREVYLAVGGCDAEGLPVTWNDSDLCLRIRARGLRVIWCPHATLLHLEQATRGSDDAPEHQMRFIRERDIMRARWNGALDTDPFLHPALIRSEADPRPHLAVQ